MNKKSKFAIGGIIIPDESMSRVDTKYYFDHIENLIENLKCCGNCGNSASCGTQKKLCKSWVWDGKTEKERMDK